MARRTRIFVLLLVRISFSCAHFGSTETQVLKIQILGSHTEPPSHGVWEASWYPSSSCLRVFVSLCESIFGCGRRPRWVIRGIRGCPRLLTVLRFSRYALRLTRRT